MDNKVGYHSACLIHSQKSIYTNDLSSLTVPMFEHASPTIQIITNFSWALLAGILLIALAGRLRISSIVLLLLGGILLGPQAIGLIEPGKLGEGLKAIIQLAVALVLFEGGLTLNIRDYKQVSTEIRRSLTIGVLITWAGSTAAIYLIFGYPLPFSALAASLIIVTGPTVIGPLLKRVNVKRQLHSFLHWEGILIDPIGVFIALLSYEWIVGMDAFSLFGLRLLTGIGAGLAAGFIISFIIRKKIIGEDLLNVFVLSSALGAFALADMIVPESGLMSAVIAGLVVGYQDIPEVENLKNYKSQLNELLIGLLFVLLAANLDLQSLKELYDFRMLIVIVVIIFLIRPLNIFFSTLGTERLTIRDRLFLSWIAPRGIVAASMASLFTLNLRAAGMAGDVPEIRFLEAFTYGVIIVTVVFQGFSGKFVGKLLGVLEPARTGWLVVGAHRLARETAAFIRNQGFHVVVVDTNIHLIRQARREDLPALAVNALTVDPQEYTAFHSIGNVLAVTTNANLNELICQRWKKVLDKPNLYKWGSHHNGETGASTKSIETGRPVWSSLRSSSLTTLEETPTAVTTLECRIEDIPGELLICQSGKKMTPLPGDEATGECNCLYYRPVKSETDLYIKSNRVLYIEAKGIPEAMEQILQNVIEEFPAADINSLRKHFSQSEREFFSVIGYGTALPHAYLSGLEKTVVYMARLIRPIKPEYASDAIENIFLVLSPTGKPREHIDILSRISRFLIRDDNRRLLEEAENREDLVRVFARYNRY